jgi:hypothetical protein
MASKKVTKTAASKKTRVSGKKATAETKKAVGGGNKPTGGASPSKSRTIETGPPVVVIAMSWQEASAGYSVNAAVAQLAGGSIGECPPCGFMAFNKGIDMSATLQAAGGPQTLSPTCVKVYQFANEADAQTWANVDGPRFDLIMGLNKPA